jgi:hypothetical protein
MLAAACWWIAGFGTPVEAAPFDEISPWFSLVTVVCVLFATVAACFGVATRWSRYRNGQRRMETCRVGDCSARSQPSPNRRSRSLSVEL